MSKRNAIAIAGWAVALAFAVALSAFAADKPKDAPKPGGKDIEYVDPPGDEKDVKPPIQRDAPTDPDSVSGFLVLSNGTRVEGRVHLTRDATLKFFDPDRKKLIDVRLAELTHIEQKPVDEHMEKEWRWLEDGNDTKVYTGREYPMRELTTTLHFKDGRTLTGPLASLIFVAGDNGDQRFLIQKRQKGECGQKLADLVYVTCVDFRPPEKKPNEKKDDAKAPAK